MSSGNAVRKWLITVLPISDVWGRANVVVTGFPDQLKKIIFLEKCPMPLLVASMCF